MAPEAPQGLVDALRDRDRWDVVHDHLEVVGPSVLGAMGTAAPPTLQTLHWDLRKHPEFYSAFDGRGRVRFAAVSASQLERAPANLRRQTLGVVPLAAPPGLPVDAPRGEHALVLARITADKGQDTAARVCRRAGIPLVLAGPTLVDKVIPARLDFLNSLYWPVVVVLCICFLATLYHVSVPVRTSWRYNLPGATLTMIIWIFGSYLLRWVLTATAGESTSIYGPLAAPIIVLLWLYLLSIAVLIGAAVNAAFDRVWPESETARARMELVRRLKLRAMIPRLRRIEEEQERFPEVRVHPQRALVIAGEGQRLVMAGGGTS